jgi:hypothetical protein
MPNERSTERPNFLQRIGTSARNFGRRQMAEARATNPFSDSFRWQQGVDAALSAAGLDGGANLWNAETGRWQFPGQGVATGAWRGIQGLLGGGDRPGYTPQPGMGIMPNPSGWQQPPPEGGSINIQPNVPGTLPQGQGPQRSYGLPPPRTPGEGARNSMTASNAALRHAEEMRVLMAMFGTGLPRGER